MIALALAIALASPPALGAQDDFGPVVVASKPFAESYVLAEVFAQALEAHGIAVDRRFGFGMTELLMQALVGDRIDIYPEYTGTGLAAILGETAAGGSVAGASAAGGSAAVFRRVSNEFATRWGVQWLPPLGFENTYAIAMRREAADSLGVHTLSTLAAIAPDLAGGFSPDFIGRADGLDGLAATYGIAFRETRSLLQAVKYQALREGEVDVIDAYSTDGAIARHGFATIADDRGFFPPYDAAPLVSRALYRNRPEAVLALTRLAGRIDVETMRRANERVEIEGRPVAEVARTLLSEIGLGAETNAPRDGTEDERTRNAPAPLLVELARHVWSGRDELARQVARHLLLVLASLGAAILVAVPAGVALERRRTLAGAALRVTAILQTIPSMALLAFMIPVFGIGIAPAVVALFLYSLLPILRNTFTGIVEAAPEAVAAGRALGMTEVQLLARIRLPLAAPVIMAGIRTAAVINVGTATLAAFIGAGGLGDPIVAGLSLSDPVMILSGAVPAAALALLVDATLARAESAVAPKGVAEGRR